MPRLSIYPHAFILLVIFLLPEGQIRYEIEIISLYRCERYSYCMKYITNRRKDLSVLQYTLDFYKDWKK